MINYSFSEKFFDRLGNEVCFKYAKECPTQVSLADNGWKTYRINAFIGDENVGYMTVSNITESEFDQNYNILKYLELYKDWDLGLIKENRVNKALEKGLEETDEIIFKPNAKRLVSLLNKNLKVIDESKLKSINDENVITEIFEVLLDAIESKYEDDFLKFREMTLGQSIVEFIHVNEDKRKQGIGKAIYQAAGIWCSYNNMNLHSSYSQTEGAKKSWENMKKSNEVPTKLNKISKYYYLDYKPYLKNKFNSNLFCFKKKLEKYSDDEKLNSLITLLWAKGNPKFGTVFHEELSHEEEKSITYIFGENPMISSIGGITKITIDEQCAKQIKKIIENLSCKDQSFFNYINNKFNKKELKKVKYKM